MFTMYESRTYENSQVLDVTVAGILRINTIRSSRSHLPLPLDIGKRFPKRKVST